MPPTARTRVDDDGHSAPPSVPWSPLALIKVIPVWPAGVVKWLSLTVWFDVSAPPQLIEIATTPGTLRAVSTAVSKSLVLSDLASTTTIVAPGAMACAHSTSSDSSCAQPESTRPPARLIWASAGSDSP